MRKSHCTKNDTRLNKNWKRDQWLYIAASVINVTCQDPKPQKVQKNADCNRTTQKVQIIAKKKKLRFL